MFTVQELTDAIRTVLDEAFPGEVWVEGEISSLNRSPAGHVYFDLIAPREGGQPPAATIPVTLFSSARQHVNRMLLRVGGGVRMADGMRVRIRGRVDLHAARGRISLRMSGIDPTYTLGLLITERDRLARVLAEEGVLRRNAEHALPALPRRLGLVTSDGSAAMADFLHELEGSGIRWRVLFADARVQGAGADRHVVAAIRAVAERGADVIAVVRGGGARTDLATFDSEALARAIAAAPVPVLTGIGHEIDTSVADLVAHTSFKTPTACAAALVDGAQRLVARSDVAWAAIVDRARRALARSDERLARDAGRASGVARHHLRRHEVDLDHRRRAVADRARRAIRVADQHVVVAAARTAALDPARTLARGWSITHTADGRLVRDAAELSPGDVLVTWLASGTATSVVTTPEAPSASPIGGDPPGTGNPPDPHTTEHPRG